MSPAFAFHGIVPCVALLYVLYINGINDKVSPRQVMIRMTQRKITKESKAGKQKIKTIEQNLTT